MCNLQTLYVFALRECTISCYLQGTYYGENGGAGACSFSVSDSQYLPWAANTRCGADAFQRLPLARAFSSTSPTMWVASVALKLSPRTRI